MSLKEQISKDIITAMKAKEADKLSVLRMLKSKFIEHETSAKGSEVDDDKAIAIIQSLIKQRQESIKMYEENDRQETADSEKAEVVVLSAYLPAFVSEDIVVATVKEVVEQMGASDPKDMGKVMGASMGKLKKLGDLVDGAMVQKAVKAALGA